jgi:hypothetical protein
MENKSTHFIFDGEKIVISPDLYPIVNFLQGVEREVEEFLGFEKKLESIIKQHLETLKLVLVLTQKLKENLIDFNFSLSEHPASIADKLRSHRPIRSEMIVLFAYLETLIRLNFAYDNKIDDGEKIRKLTLNQSVWESFYNNFCLSENNPWGQQNPGRLRHINAQDLRYLRNSLTHFFSVDKGLSISYTILDAKSRKIEQESNFKVKFISPEDLYEIIKGSALLMIKKWNDDCRKSLESNSIEFKERIMAVNSLIEKSGPVIIKNKHINI